MVVFLITRVLLCYDVADVLHNAAQTLFGSLSVCLLISHIFLQEFSNVSFGSF